MHAQIVRLLMKKLCSSDLISDRCIRKSAEILSGGIWLSIDFRANGLFIFQALRSLCNLANETMNNNLNRFYLNRYASIDVTPSVAFESQIRSFIDQFESATKREFSTAFRTLQDVTQANLYLTT